MSTEIRDPGLQPLRYPEQDKRLTSGNFWDLLTIVGPGFILASVTIGNGEIFSATRGGAIFAFMLVWTFILGAIMKGVVVYAAGRYMVLTGEHPFARFGHIMPGPKGKGKHWMAAFIGVLAVMCFPAWIVAFIQAMAQWTPWTFHIGDGTPVMWMGLAWGFIAWLTLFIRDFSIIERFQAVIVLILVFFSVVAVFVAQPDWLQLLRGMVPGWPSEYPMWVQQSYPEFADRPIPLEIMAYIGALGGGVYDYIGYLGTFREKDWGMMGEPTNAKINLQLQTLEKGQEVPIALDDENMVQAQAGLKAAKIDTGVSFFAVALFAITFMILGHVIMGVDGLQAIPGNDNILKDQAAFFTQIHPVLKYLYQLAIWAAFWGSMQALMTQTYPYTVREAFSPIFPALSNPKNWFKVRVAVASYAYFGAFILDISGIQYVDAISFAGILGGVFALGLWGLLQVRMDRLMLPRELQMHVVLKVLVIISSVTMFVMGAISVVTFFTNL